MGAVLSLLLVATPLWLLGGSAGSTSPGAGVVPLAALATLPDEPAQFDIGSILEGGWVGEMCPNEGEPIEVHLEFSHGEDDAFSYALSVGGELSSEGVLGSGACDIDGEDIEFHAFLAILSDCDEACGVDRIYEGHFEDGAIVGDYNDAVAGEECLSCVGGGTWWLEPEA